MMIAGVWLTHQMVPDLSRDLGVHPTTVRRWLNNRALPRPVEALLDITHNGNLGRIHPDWRGWNINIKDGELVTPIIHRGGRRTYRHKDIFLMQITHQQLSTVRHENADLSAKVEGQKKTIQDLRSQIVEQQQLIEKLEARLGELTSGNVAIVGCANRVPSSRDRH